MSTPSPQRSKRRWRNDSRAMRIVILTAGSLGDVRPYVALGKGLRAAGHDVAVAAYNSFQPIVLGHGLRFHPLRDPFRELSRTEAWTAWQASSGRPLGYVLGLRHLVRAARTGIIELFNDAWHACTDSDAVIYPTAGLGGPDIAEKRGIRGYWAHLYPVMRTAAFPCFAGPAPSHLGGVYNRLTYRVASYVYRRVFGSALDAWRKQTLSLPPRARSSAFDPFVAGNGAVLYGFSPTLVPKPPDWGGTHHVTGYWHLDAPDARAPAALDAFLRDGEPPIHINAHSLGFDARFVQALIAAVPRATGCRLIVQTARDVHTSDSSAEVFVTRGSLPHDWLFPRVSGVVHHGGAGTVATVLRAGVPSLGVPAFFDQPFWCRRLAALGVAPPPLARREVTVERLVAGITHLAGDQQLRERARMVASVVQREAGVAAAVDVLGHDLVVERNRC
jgi:sterol 3beta-glucosyltransferase